MRYAFKVRSKHEKICRARLKIYFFFDGEPCHLEKMFWYLKKDHIQGIISELKKLLNGIHWIWLTADCPVNEQQNASYKNVIADSSNKSPVEPFADYNAFHDFFTCNWYCYLENRRIIPHIVLRFVWSMFFVYCILPIGFSFCASSRWIKRCKVLRGRWRWLHGEPMWNLLDFMCLIVFISISLLYFWKMS